MKLSEALENAKVAVDSDCHPYNECMDPEESCHRRMRRGLDELIAAIEEHLAAERKSAETLLCLADLQRHGGE